MFIFTIFTNINRAGKNIFDTELYRKEISPHDDNAMPMFANWFRQPSRIFKY